MRPSRILVVTPADSSPLDFGPLGLRARLLPSDDFKSAVESFTHSEFDAILVSATADSVGEAIAFFKKIGSSGHRLPCILITSWSSEELAIEALNSGVNLYLRHPLNGAALSEAVWGTLQRCSSSPGTPADCPFAGAERLIGKSTAVCALRDYVQKVARCQSNVLITGETGTGKELIAELIHANSPRRLCPFVCLNGTAIPDSLLESELFGYERGAFTGANARHQGKLTLGNTGTVFFDEIGDIGLNVQAKLLRAIDGKPVYRLGGNKEVPLDIRILAATNQNLEAAVEQERFRRDLFYRLNVVRIQVPPLRERREDIPALVDHYTEHFNTRFGVQVECFTREALAQMVSYGWPGNIRELKNVIEVVFVNQPGRGVDEQDLPPCITNYLTGRAKTTERDALLSALVTTNWNKTKAAEQLHWSRMTLNRKMASYNVVPTR
jgi:DNA-binding NtrC family response regulator